MRNARNRLSNMVHAHSNTKESKEKDKKEDERNSFFLKDGHKENVVKSNLDLGTLPAITNIQTLLLNLNALSENVKKEKTHQGGIQEKINEAFAWLEQHKPWPPLFYQNMLDLERHVSKEKLKKANRIHNTL
eukprot:TRINITY_DN3052_c0_g1_i1.p2 TRINITY_DN3052_c0_g1~~TRINITY_DN3052_c0_g1_i1.p2  ORF type:complete len:132 (-),score=28.75 TRINITY_DN3052_c0_g1_i1:219-614(-)